jgi:hypothetical protein
VTLAAHVIKNMPVVGHLHKNNRALWSADFVIYFVALALRGA